MGEKKNGKFARHIIEDEGFEVEVLCKSCIKVSSKRWEAAYQEHRVIGLTDTRKGHSGRPRERELSLEEQNTRFEEKINLLQGVNELLKKIRFAERELKK